MDDLKHYDERIISNLSQFSFGKKDKRVMLTFDDGPSRHLNKILDILHFENVPAMFFWQSRLLHSEREWKRTLAEGHVIGTHSIKHKNLTKLSEEEQYKDLSYSIKKIESITNQRVKYFRPPFGRFNDSTIKVADSLQLTPIMWSISSMDWELKDNPDRIIKNVVENLENGSIVLLHELFQTEQILNELIQEIKKRGYQFVNLKDKS